MPTVHPGFFYTRAQAAIQRQLIAAHPERLPQTIVEVAGRAGRGRKPGEVLIQTEFPVIDCCSGKIRLNEGMAELPDTAAARNFVAAIPRFTAIAAYTTLADLEAACRTASLLRRARCLHQ
jgi:primosomal protein N'